MKKALVSVAVLLAALTACQKEIGQPEEVIPAPAQMRTISVQAVKTPVTKALELDGKTIKAFWGERETVAVYVGNSSTRIGTLAPSTYGDASTTLQGTIDVSGLEEGSELTLIYPGNGNMSYAGQDGTLETIARNYDFASAEVKVNEISGESVAVSEAAFSNLGAIITFSLMNADGSAALPVDELTISTWKSPIINECTTTESGWQNKYGPVTVVPGSAMSDITVALCCAAVDPGTFCLTARAGTQLYECVRDDALFMVGKYYTGKVKMQEVSYTVAGGPDAVFGYSWDPTYTANDMEFADGIYTKVRRGVAKGTVMALKVVKNHSWDWSIGGSYPEDDNLYVTAWEEGDLNVTFNPANKEVQAWMDFYTEPIDIPTVYTIVGDYKVFGTDWYPADTANDMEDAGDGTWVKTYRGVAPGAVEFRVIKDRSWEGSVPASQYDPYYYEIPAYGDITIVFDPAADDLNKITVTFTPGEEPEYTYTVAGSPETLFGSLWNASDNNNNMTAVGDGTYSISYNVLEAIDEVQFKVVKEHDWSYNWPEQNYVYTGITGSGVFTIVFNPATGEITPSFEEKVFEDTYTLAGNYVSIFGEAWNPELTANDMVLQPDGTYLKEYAFAPAGNLEFKVVKNHSWNNDSWPSEDNYYYTLPIGGSLAILFDPATGRIDVSRSSTCTVVGSPEALFGQEWVPSLERNDMTLQADGTYFKSYPISEAGLPVEFKIAINHSWDESYGVIGSTENILYTTVNTNDLKITFDPVTKVITCDQTRVVSIVGTMSGWAFDSNYDMTLNEEDGLYYLTIQRLAAGTYEFKVAMDHSWDENYGVGGIRDGSNYTINVDLASDVTFIYNPETHIVTVRGNNLS